MPSITAIELGADTCALARTAVRGQDIRVLAVETLDPAAFAGDDSFTAGIRQARRALKLPRRARVVVWGLPEGSSVGDAAVKPLLAPLTGAGFSVERVVSPCDALATLARVRVPRGERATCWLAINRGGVAIVVVQPGRQLYAHSFIWDSTVGSSGSQARMLQRYSLVAYLAPEVKRAMAEARKQGTLVDAVVTCGNLPDLRSLTMPLIEELDVEVETLDSLEGLDVKPPVADRISEAAAAIRLACAGAIAREARRLDQRKHRGGQRASALRLAAALAALAALGLAWYQLRGAKFDISAMLPRKPAAPTATVARANPPANAPSSSATRPSAPRVAPQTQVTAPSTTTRNAPAVVAPPSTGAAKAPTVSQRQPRPAPRSEPLPQRQQPASSARPSLSTPQTRRTVPDATPAVPVTQTDAPAAEARSRNPPGQPFPDLQRAAPLLAPPSPADNPAAGTRAPRRPSAQRDEVLPPLLKDPLPRVTAILVANDRRFATINEGQIIGIGDVLGRRIVVGIEDRAVVLREPSGVQLRLGLGGKILSVDRGR